MTTNFPAAPRQGGWESRQTFLPDDSPLANLSPRSASRVDPGLLVYDVCRPFCMTVQQAAISDWRWVGLPVQLNLSQIPARVGRRVMVPDFSTPQVRGSRCARYG